MRKITMFLVDVTGNTWDSDPVDVDYKKLSSIQKSMENIKDVGTFLMDVDGVPTYFNTNNIIAVWWEDSV